MELHDLNITTVEEFLDYLNDLLNDDADMVTRSEFVNDPGHVFVLVRLHSGVEFIVRAKIDGPNP